MLAKLELAEDLMLDENEDKRLSYVKQCVNVYALPDYYANTAAARRSDIRVSRIKLGSLENTDDLQGAVRKLAVEEGAYLAELRIEGRVAKTKVILINPLPENLHLEATPQPTPQPPTINPPSHVEDRLSRLETMLETVIVKMTTQPAQPPPSPPTPPRKLVDELRDAKELITELQGLNGNAGVREPQASTTSNPQSSEDQAWMMLLKDETLRSKIASSLTSVLGNAPEESDMSWPEMFRRIAVQQPLVANRALSLVERLLGKKIDLDESDSTDDDEEESDEVDDFVRETGGDGMKIVAQLVADMGTNAPVDRAVQLVRVFTRIYPDSAATLGEALYMPVDALMELLPVQMADGARLVKLPHARSWLLSLQQALKAG
jgi:hypothetical protein